MIEKRSKIYIFFVWDLIERMVGWMEFHRVGAEFLKDLKFRKVLLEFWQIWRDKRRE